MTSTGPGSDAAAPLSVRYRLRPAIAVRLIGVGCLGLAVIVVAAAIRTAVPALDHSVPTVVGAVLGLVALALIGFGVWAMLGPGLLRLDQAGLVNRTGLRVGVRRLAWDGISDISRPAGRVDVLLATMRDGRTSVIYTAVLDTSSAALEAEIGARANRALGYRPLT